jgi:WD40 repeat protein
MVAIVIATAALWGCLPLAYAEEEKVSTVGERLRLEHPGVCCVAFAPDGRILSGNMGQTFKDGKEAPAECTVRVWDLRTGKQLRNFKVQDGGAIAAFSLDGRRVMSVTETPGGDHKARLWEVETGKELPGPKMPKDRCVAWSPDWRQAFCVSEDGASYLWDLGAGKKLRDLKLKLPEQRIAALSADWKRALSVNKDEDGKDRAVRLRDVDNGRELHRLEGHKDRVTCVAFSPDRRRAVSGGGNYNSPRGAVDSSVRVWDLEKGKELRRFFEGGKAAVMHVGFTPDGRRVLSSGNFSLDSPSDATIRLWDVESGKQVRHYKGHEKDRIPVLVTGLVVSPDGRYAASAGIDGTVRVWELPN